MTGIKVLFVLTALSWLPLALAIDVAVIKGEPITEGSFRDELEALGPRGDLVKNSPEIRMQFLEHLIESKMLSMEATKEKLDQSPSYLRKVAAAKRDILANEFISAYIDQETTDAALEKYFEANRDAFSDLEVRASHILLKENQLKLAEDVLKQALAGANFDDLARKYSIGPSGPKGGDLDYFKRGRMVAAFDEAAFNTPKGKIHPKLVKTQFGYHIIKVIDSRGGGKVSFKDKKQQIKSQRSKEIRDELMAKLHKDYEVSVDAKAVESLKF